MDVLSLVIGFIVGLVCGSSAIYIYTKYRGKGDKKVSITSSPLSPSAPTGARLVESVALDRAKRELKTLLLEKELLSNALTRVYEAESEGMITKEEREKLSEKYREQLKSVNEKLSNLEALIEVGELEKLRNELFNLLKQKIEQIEERLQRARSRLEEMRGVAKPTTSIEATHPTPIPVPISTTPSEKKVEKPVAREQPEVDTRVKKLRDEVLEALAKLEQIDIEE
ncbi:MAG: hypothetical protein RMJ31_03375 [Nitrososphaerota archaeon]|nr:hypothetical protein [Nitrososphaerales archaeon]MDW8044798.1 hypothetical protein [Nitrososphaerota archaeon]